MNSNTQHCKVHNVDRPIKINGHTKKQENMIRDQQKNQPVETDTKMMDMMISTDRTLKQL